MTHARAISGCAQGDPAGRNGADRDDGGQRHRSDPGHRPGHLRCRVRPQGRPPDRHLQLRGHGRAPASRKPATRRRSAHQGVAHASRQDRGHKVKTGESIDSLAKKAGRSAGLARFNWGTTCPRNQRPPARRGRCTKKTKDGKNYVFTDDDSPASSSSRPSERGGLATEKTTSSASSPSCASCSCWRTTTLRVPEADYEATLADGTKKKESGQSGIAAIDDLRRARRRCLHRP